jgi:hypothetical protein
MIFAGTVIAAAVASGTAMTAANTVPDSIAGYGEGMVSGVNVDNIKYTAVLEDSNLLASVEFVLTDDITLHTEADKVTMTLKSGAADVDGEPTGGSQIHAPYACEVGDAWNGSVMSVECAAIDTPRFDSFTSVGLTVMQ